MPKKHDLANVSRQITTQAGLACSPVVILCLVESISVRALVMKDFVALARFKWTRAAIAEGLRSEYNVTRKRNRDRVKVGLVSTVAAKYVKDNSTVVYTAARSFVMPKTHSLLIVLDLLTLSTIVHVAKPCLRIFLGLNVNLAWILFHAATNHVVKPLPVAIPAKRFVILGHACLAFLPSPFIVDAAGIHSRPSVIKGQKNRLNVYESANLISIVVDTNVGNDAAPERERPQSVKPQNGS